MALDERVLRELLLHALPLHAFASTVDDAHLDEPLRPRLAEVLVHHGRDVSRREVVEVELVVDRHDVHVVRRRLGVAVLVSNALLERAPRGDRWDEPSPKPREEAAHGSIRWGASPG